MKKEKFTSFEDLDDFGRVIQKVEFDRAHRATRVFVELEDLSELEALEELRRQRRREYANTVVCAIIRPDFSIKEISDELFYVYTEMRMLPSGCTAIRAARWQVKQLAEKLRLRYKFQLEAEGKLKPRIPKNWR